MSAMSASSGLMPLSLISEHKAAQGGPPPVQQLAFAPEKHPLVQAPKPTPNGMEPSPPLIPVSPPPQPGPQPSLPCGGVSETPVTNEESRADSGVPGGLPAEPSHSSLPAVPEQPTVVEPGVPPPVPEPLISSAVATPSEPLLPNQPPAEVPTPEVLSLAQPTQPVPTQQPPAAPAPLQPDLKHGHKEQPAAAKFEPIPESGTQKAPEPVSAEVLTTHSATEEVKETSTKPTNSFPPDAQSHSKPEEETKSEELPKSNVEPNGPQPAAIAPAPSASPAPAPPTTTASVTQPRVAQSVGRPPKRTKAAKETGGEKKSTPTSGGTPTAAAPSGGDAENGDDKRTKRKRLPTQVYQSPIPEESLIAKFSKIDKTSAPDDKLIVFYRNEFLAVRNTEEGFYVCQAMQNVYKSSSRIRIRWLSQLANTDHYSPDFYDTTEFDCILTNLNLERIEKNKYRLPEVESQRTQSILKRAIDVENGIAPPEEATVTEEHPDGLDLSLYRNEDQLKKRKKGTRNKSNKKKLKKAVAEAKKSRDTLRRNKPIVETKKPNPINPQTKRIGRAGKIEKPVVQRIIAAKKMGRRKGASPSVVTKAPAPTPAPAPAAPVKEKEAPKKKEVSGRGATLKRKSSEPQPAPVPDKKLKPGASKTRNL